MDALIAGFVLHAIACVADNHRDCRELPARSAPTSFYVCERAMAVAIERAPSIDPETLGLPGPAHFEFRCDPAAGRS